MYICGCKCIRTYIHTCIHAGSHAVKSSSPIFWSIHTHIYTHTSHHSTFWCIYTHTYIHKYMHTRIHTCRLPVQGHRLDFLQHMHPRHIRKSRQSNSVHPVRARELHSIHQPNIVCAVRTEQLSARLCADHVREMPSEYRLAHHHGRVRGVVWW
jgi:hypothetical protein